jgi:serine/threonine protein kinase
MSPNFSPGARLGHYAIKSQLGAGGMGEVYLAQDTKLDRKVGGFAVENIMKRCPECRRDYYDDTPPYLWERQMKNE